MISVVCVYNNEKILSQFLLKSLESQMVEYQLIRVDNRQGQFKSAAQALNYGACQAQGKYLMFVHQDVFLISPRWLSQVENILDTLPALGIAGVAGNNEEFRGSITNIYHGCLTRPAGKARITVPTRVQTVDECLAIIPRSVFHKLCFDEFTCDDWHLYAVDYALCVKQQGLSAYVIPADAYHASTGRQYNLRKVLSNGGAFPAGYYRTLKKLLSKHRKNYHVIYTTCGNWSTSLSLYYLQRWGYLGKDIVECCLKIGTK